MHRSLFEGVVAVRYRDTVDDIRLSCIQAIAKCAIAHPEEYMKDSCLKYVGWLLNDQQSASVRAGTLQQLQERPPSFIAFDLCMRPLPVPPCM